MSDPQRSLPEEGTATGKTPDPNRARPKGARKPLTELDEKGRALVEAMTLGCDEDEAAKHGVRPFEPLSLEDAAAVVGIRRRNARYIFGQKVFLAAYAENLQLLRKSHHARAVKTIAHIMDHQGEDTAADRTVRLKACNALLDAPETRAPAVSVTVNNGVQLTAGIVLRLPAGVAAPPLETGAEPSNIIDHRDQHHEPRLIPSVRTTTPESE